jgi:integrase
MWMERVRTRLLAGAAQFYEFAVSGGWRGRLARGRCPAPQRASWPTSSPSAQKSSIRTVSDLIELFFASSAYRDLTPTTKHLYKLYLGRVGEKFGDWPLSALEKRGARTVIRQWRDDVLVRRRRTADATIGTFRRLVNFGIDEEYLTHNPVAGLGRLHTKTRRDIIWSDSQISSFLAKAPRHLARALLLAVWTGQRQGDLLSLTWDSYDGAYIKLQQRKVARGSSGRRVKVLVSAELREVLAEIWAEQRAQAKNKFSETPPLSDYILTTGYGEPWRGGFKRSWRKAVADAGISGVTFHDLRGTFITLSHRAGASIREIAEASGHNEYDCERVIRENYLAPGGELVISRLEAKRNFTNPDWAAESETSVTLPMVQPRFTGPRRLRRSTQQLLDHRPNNEAPFS